MIWCVYRYAHMDSDLPITLSQASGVPFYRQITDQIADLIRSGRLAPGAPLPSLRELSAILAVSLITTRRAFADLEAAGLVVQRQGQGTFVSETVGDRALQRVRDEAMDGLRKAVDRARQVGLTAAQVREAVEEKLGQTRADSGAPKQENQR